MELPKITEPKMSEERLDGAANTCTTFHIMSWMHVNNLVGAMAPVGRVFGTTELNYNCLKFIYIVHDSILFHSFLLLLFGGGVYFYN